MIVLKFGGTSVSTKERIDTICSIVQREQESQPIVVVSAIRGVTDLLLSLRSLSVLKQKEALRELVRMHQDLAISCFGSVPQELQEYIDQCNGNIKRLLGRKKTTGALQDEIVSYGEMLSSFLISYAVQQSGVSSQQVVATELIATDGAFTNAEFLPGLTTKQSRKVLLPLLRKGIVPVVTGFIGRTRDGKTTTLGRGGSDYSAAILGFAIGASEIQIWTDVDGIYTSDPRSVPTAMRLQKVTYREASELAAFGAKVLHPRTILPAITAGIPVRVLNTLNPESEGTRIIATGEEHHRVSAIASQKKVTLVNLYSTEMLHGRGFLVRIFTVFAKHAISVDLVSVSEVSVSVTLENTEDLKSAVAELSLFTAVTTREVGIVSLIGEGIVGVPHIMRNIFSVLDSAKIQVYMISLGASDINISLAIPTKEVATAVRLLHDTILLSEISQERSYL